MLLLNLKAPTSFLLQPASLQFESNISLFLGQVVSLNQLTTGRWFLGEKNRGKGWGGTGRKKKERGKVVPTRQGTYFTVMLEIFRFKLELSQKGLIVRITFFFFILTENLEIHIYHLILWLFLSNTMTNDCTIKLNNCRYSHLIFTIHLNFTDFRNQSSAAQVLMPVPR